MIMYETPVKTLKIVPTLYRRFSNSDYVGVCCRPSGIFHRKGATKSGQSKLAKQLDEEDLHGCSGGYIYHPRHAFAILPWQFL
jgi:hypothetical protein